MLAKLLKPYLDQMKGQKTYLAGLGLVGLAVYQFSSGDLPGAIQSGLAGLGALGLRHAISEIPAPPAPTTTPPAVPPMV